MSPSISYLITSFLLLNIAVCAPTPSAVPQEIAHEKEVLDAIGNLKDQITSDPQGVTKTWTGVGHDSHDTNSDTSGSSPPKEKKQKVVDTSEEENTWQQQSQETSNSGDDWKDYWKNQQKQWEDYYNGNNNNNNGWPQPDYWKKPGWHGQHHSSGTHSTANWNGADSSGCVPGWGWGC